MQVELVSPERITYSGDAEKVLVRTIGGGDLEFLRGHVPFIGVLQVSAAKIVQGESAQVFAIHQGFVQLSGDKVTILSDVSESKEDIDVARAETSKAAAEAAIVADGEDAAAKGALRRAIIRLGVASGELPAT
ncbi:MAG: F-type H+-transporting ATPase subunit epsilon [Verrucomicrobiales bacterium]|jgi:F-type H+-transporting ATPase subunit epsilon